jgi:hypothetical protein
MPDYHCYPCDSSSGGGGGIAVVAALVIGGILVVTYIEAIITFLLMMLVASVLLAVLGVGSILFLRKFIVPKVMPGRVRQALAATMRYEDDFSVQKAEVIQGGISERMGKNLETGSQGSVRAITGAATVEPIEGISGEYEYGFRPELVRLHNWVRGSGHQAGQDWQDE